MKRKETFLDQKLAMAGWVLTKKTYVGKHSEHVGNYIYEKGNEEIVLDAKRERVVDYGIKGVGEDLFNDATLRPYLDQLRNLTDFVGDITNAYTELPNEGFNDKEVEMVAEYFMGENNHE